MALMSQGAVGGKVPTDSGYAQAAINHSSQHIVLPREYIQAWKAAPSGSKPPRSFTRTLAGGSYVDFFLIENNSTANWSPRAYFSEPLANPDSQGLHFKVLSVAPDGTVTYGVEDTPSSSWTGSEPDYNDFQFTLSYTQVTGSPATKFYVTNNGATTADDKVYEHASPAMRQVIHSG